MNDLELCKKFSEMEGVDAFVYRGSYLLYPNDQGSMFENGMTCDWYNPITNLALNCAARDKYKIEIEYVSERLMYVSISEYLVNEKIPIISVRVNNKSGIPRAVIECILKSTVA